MQLRDTRTPILNEGSVEEKREEIRQYFHKTHSIDERLYDTLARDEAFYIRAEPLRHPLIFYLGHTAVFYINNSFSPTYTRETLIGFLVGVPLVYGISKVKQKLPYNALLGSLSYGVFLSHFLSIWILNYMGIPLSHSYRYLLFVLLISLFISYIGILFVEKHVNKVRYS